MLIHCPRLMERLGFLVMSAKTEAWLFWICVYFVACFVHGALGAIRQHLPPGAIQQGPRSRKTEIQNFLRAARAWSRKTPPDHQIGKRTTS